jgi:hypothetical protein
MKMPVEYSESMPADTIDGSSVINDEPNDNADCRR